MLCIDNEILNKRKAYTAKKSWLIYGKALALEAYASFKGRNFEVNASCQCGIYLNVPDNTKLLTAQYCKITSCKVWSIIFTCKK